MIDQCNDYGFDTIEIGGVLAMYMEAPKSGYAKGAASPGATSMAMVAIVARSPSAKGIGDMLAEGSGARQPNSVTPNFECT